MSYWTFIHLHILITLRAPVKIRLLVLFNGQIALLNYPFCHETTKIAVQAIHELTSPLIFQKLRRNIEIISFPCQSKLKFCLASLVSGRFTYPSRSLTISNLFPCCCTSSIQSIFHRISYDISPLCNAGFKH